MKNKPMTTADLFNKICKILEKKSLMPEILEYALDEKYHNYEIKNYEFDFDLTLEYGGNEGIYLNCAINGNIGIGQECKRYSLGTFKTLREDREAMYIMAKLYADFVVEGSQFVNDNLDNFTWIGADVSAYDENGTYKIGYSCKKNDKAKETAAELLKKYPKVVLRYNDTREEKVFENMEAK